MPADPYLSNWTGHPVDWVFEETGGAELYATYKSFSDWQHWSVGGVGRVLKRSEDGVAYDNRASDWSELGLALVFQSLFQTAEVACGHLDLPARSRLNEVRNRWLAEFGR